MSENVGAITTESDALFKLESGGSMDSTEVSSESIEGNGINYVSQQKIMHFIKQLELPEVI